MIKLSHKRKMELQNEKAKKNDTTKQQENLPKRNKNAQKELDEFRKTWWYAPLKRTKSDFDYSGPKTTH